jgi:lipooligosaccharide transport system permease protein
VSRLTVDAVTSSSPVLRLLERELHILRRLWHGIVFSAFVQPLLYLLAMGVGIGGYVDRNGVGSLGGLSYLDFVAPGLLAATAFQLGVGDSLWPVTSGTQWDKRYHAMVATPIGPGQILAAHLGWQAVRTTIAVVAFLVVATPLGAIASPWAVLALPAAVLLVVATAAVVATYSTWVEDASSFPLIMRIGVLPLFLFSGTFFPIGQLPPLVRALAPLSPLYHGVELCRAATSGQARSAGAVMVHVVVLLGVVAAASVVGRRTFARRLTP